MLPTDQFSGDSTPQTPWQPDVWSTGPDALVAKAQQALWQDSNEVQGSLGASSGSVAMAGSPQPENESDQLINGSTPGDSPSPSAPGTSGSGGRAAQWHSMMTDLRSTEPLASWSSGAHDGPANPPA